MTNIQLLNFLLSEQKLRTKYDDELLRESAFEILEGLYVELKALENKELTP